MRIVALDGRTLVVCAVLVVLAACSSVRSQFSPAPLTQHFGDAGTMRHGLTAYSILHKFGGAGDGYYPAAALVDVKGTLYGTTADGGAYGEGTVFEVTTSGQETVLHSFGGAPNDGRQPQAELLDVNGTLYGTTSAGGGAHNGGTVFSITPDGTEKVLHSFEFKGGGGAVPLAGLIAANGILYGTTSGGGAPRCGLSCGTVFSITKAGMYKVLHHFGSGADGNSPQARLLDVGGTLYGTTVGGGFYGGGTVFTISAGEGEQVLHNFPVFSASDGSNPAAGLIDVAGTLYGTTSQGGAYGFGTIFTVATDGSSERVVHSFSGSDGSEPVASLKNVNGVLYGTASRGGVNNLGAVFSMTKSGKETVLHSFANGSGVNPIAGVIPVAGRLYGTTAGGIKHSYGNVFSLAP